MFYGSLTTKPSIYDQLCGQVSLFQCLLSWCLNRSCVTALVGTLNMEFPKIMKDFAKYRWQLQRQLSKYWQLPAISHTPTQMGTLPCWSFALPILHCRGRDLKEGILSIISTFTWTSWRRAMVPRAPCSPGWPWSRPRPAPPHPRTTLPEGLNIFTAFNIFNFIAAAKLNEMDIITRVSFYLCARYPGYNFYIWHRRTHL